MSARRCSFRQRPEDSPCPSPAYYLLELASKEGSGCKVCLCREHVHKAWGFGQQVLLERFPRRLPKLRSIRLLKLRALKDPSKPPSSHARPVNRETDEKEKRSAFEGCERRAASRLAANFEVAYLYGQSLRFTRAVNVSKSGIAFLSETRFSNGTELNLKLLPTALFGTQWFATHSVVRRSDGKIIGAEFSPESLVAITQFVALLR